MTLIDIRPEDFTPSALREHAEVLVCLSEGLTAEANQTSDPEQRLVVEDMATDCVLFAAVFIGLADRGDSAFCGASGDNEMRCDRRKGHWGDCVASRAPNDTVLWTGRPA